MAHSMLFSSITKSTLLLGGFALFGVIILSTLNALTADKIKQNERNALLEKLTEVLPKTYNNDVLANTRLLDKKLFNAPFPVTAYLAKQDQKPVAVVFETSTSHGYSGTIKLLIGIQLSDLTLTGVRVTSHKETPGLGDKIEYAKHDWITFFTGKSYSNPPPKQWYVKKDGGLFDQFTGATITPRAVIGAIRNVLAWSHQKDNLMNLFEPLNNTGKQP